MEPLDQLEEKPLELPKHFKIIANLAHIGNGFWGVIFMIFFFLVVTNSSVLLQAFRVKYENNALVSLIYFIAILMCVIPVFGIIKMAQQQRAGFWLYAIPNGVWVAYCFWIDHSFATCIGVLSVFFIVMFSSCLKYMKD